MSGGHQHGDLIYGGDEPGTLSVIYDDGGRVDAGYGDFPKYGGDCGARAITILTGADYAEVYPHYMECTNCAQYEELLKACGLRQVYREDEAKKRVTILDAALEWGDCLMMWKKVRQPHAFAVVDGQVRDTWNCQLYGINDWPRKVWQVWR